MKLIKFLSTAVLVSILSFSAQAVEFLPVDEAYEMSYYLDGQELVIDWIITPGYYLYKDKFSYKTESEVIGDITYLDTWEEKFDPTFEEVMNVYHEAMSVRMALNTEPSKFDIQITYQGCADAGLCYPPQKVNFNVDQENRSILMVETAAKKSQNFKLGSSLGVNSNSINSSSISGVSIFAALALALVGGMILNLMPCVFPVLSIKALSIVQSAHNSDESRMQGLFYTLGVILSFLIIGLVPVLFKGLGEWIGWGFQLQSPVFIGLLLLLFFVLSLNMFGWLELGGRFMGVGQNLTEKKGLKGSFFTGVLATLVATPCVAPFMGTAIGFALSQPTWVSLLVFSVMGFGMALPMLLISWIPGLGRMLPGPGKWMVTFKQFLAFPLFATALWLLSVLVEMKGSSTLIFAGLGLLLVAIASWPPLQVKANNSDLAKASKWSLKTLLLIMAIGLILRPAPPADPWQEYSAQLVQNYVDNRQPVFVDVTAAWCITCKINEKIALSGKKFFALAASKGIQLVKADWTNPSPEVDRLIEQYGQSGVPLYLVYNKGKVKVLPQILTPELVRNTFQAI